VGRGWTALWAAVAAVLAGVLAVVSGLAVGAVPQSWKWAHNAAVLWAATGGVIVASVVIGVLQARAAGNSGKASSPAQVTRVRASGSGQAIGTNTGTVIYAGTAHIGPAPPGETADQAAAAPGLGRGRAGDTLPARNPVFTGRAGALADLAGKLAGGPVAVVAVRGLGGVGKSQLALEYAHRERASGRYRVAGWVRADSAVTVAEDLAALSPLLGLPPDATVGERAEAVVATLGGREDWLVVFDNAHRPSELRGWLPGGAGHVLITSRDRAWSGIAAQLDLDAFSRAESVTFACQRTGSADEKAAGELADELGDLPLALAQAAAYIDRQSITIAGYLGLYRDTALAARLRDAGLDSAEYPASVASTWLINFTQLSGERPASVELLRLCAFLDPDDIDLDLLTTGKGHAGQMLGRVLGDPLERTETAGALAATSLVTVPADGHLRVHRLVQAVTRDQLDDDQAAAWTSRALDLIAAVFPDDPDDHRTWAACASAAPHAEAVTGHAASSPALAPKVASLLGKLGIYLWRSAQLTAARATFQRALAIFQAAYGPDHPHVAATLGNLGNVQQQLGELAGARATLQRALAINEAAYGPDHPQVAVTLTNLGIVQRQLGELADARATLQRALAINEAAYGPDHPHVAVTLTNLGNLQQQLGELAGARATLQRALAINEAAYGPDHPHVAGTLTNLGNLQQQLGELAGARATLQRALAINEAAYGPDHPRIAVTLTNLGNLQQQLGELAGARATLQRALAINEAAYGPDHPQVAVTLTNLGSVQQALGELAGARATLQRALAIKEAAYGPDHPQVAVTLTNLGLVQQALGELAGARATLQRALAIFQAAYGPDHPNVAIVQQELGTQ
jgi:Tfp pilus assembly protein PilF